ncbi:MAG: hypothetical protein ACI4D3_09890 [Lachnospiraceae bacterium]
MDRKSSRKRAEGEKAGRGRAKRSRVRYKISAFYEGDKRIYTVLDISADRTLDDLCRMILDAFDFDDSHSYLFNFRGRGYGQGEDVYYSLPDEGRKSTDVKLEQLGLSLRKNFYFLYDFGAEWEFYLQVREIYETEEYTIDGIVSVKGELEQYPGQSSNLQAEWDEYMEEPEEEPGMFFFRIDKYLTVKEILDTRDEDSLRAVAGRFLNPLNPSGAAGGTSVEWVKDQYIRALLNDRKRLLLFLKGQAADLFFFMMTAIPEPEDDTLSWMDLMDVVTIRSEHDVQEVSVSMMYLYAMGVCEPELDQEGQIQSFRICGEMRRTYEAWINQPEPLYDMYVYQDSEKLVNVLMYRYGVIEIDRLWEISQARSLVRSAKQIKKEDFIYLLAGRMEIFNRFRICVRDGIEYLSAYQADDMEKILEARKAVPGLTYRLYEEPELKDMIEHNPYSDVSGFRKLVEMLRNSFQDEEMLVVEFIVQTIAEQAMVETDSEEIIQKTRAVLNSYGKRMTKKLQELIRRVAENMPLATRYGYTRAELARMK